MPEADATQIVTGEVRLSFVHLLTPHAQNADDDEKYSCMLLIPKSDKATVAKVKRALTAAAEAGKAKTFGGTIPKNMKTTFRDGDEEGDLERYPEMEGHYFINVGSKRKPGLINRDKSPITSTDEIYSGCYARVQMGAFAYNFNGSKGVSFGLNHVMKTRDGERLDGTTSAEDVFADYFEDEEEDSLI